eukprot:8305601-Pyramimonas_sp.AAC.1
MKEVRYARRCKTHDSKVKRLEVNTVAGSPSSTIFEDIIVPILIREKAAKLEGSAPPGDLERRTQTAIGEMEA